MILDAALSSPPVADRVVTLVNGTRIAYFESGTNRGTQSDESPIVLVHGSLCDFRYWTPQFKSLAAHRRVVAVSLPHYFPVAEQPAQEEFGIQSHVEALVKLFETEHWTHVTLVGHSRGGCVAFHLASQHPVFLSQLVLVDPGGLPAKRKVDGPAAPVLTQAYPDTDPRMQATRMIEAGDVEGGLKLFVETVSRPGFWERSGSEFQVMARDNAHTLSMQVRDVLPLYSRLQAALVTVPTLILNGEKSPKPFLSTSDTLASWMPYAQRSIIRGASHGMNLTHATEFNEQVLKFVGITG